MNGKMWCFIPRKLNVYCLTQMATGDKCAECTLLQNKISIIGAQTCKWNLTYLVGIRYYSFLFHWNKLLLFCWWRQHVFSILGNIAASEHHWTWLPGLVGGSVRGADRGWCGGGARNYAECRECSAQPGACRVQLSSQLFASHIVHDRPHGT